MIDRLASYAAKEAENEPPEERRRGEDEAKRKLEREVQRQRDRRRKVMEQEQRQRDLDDGLRPPAMSAAVQKGEETEGWGAAVNVLPPGHPDAAASRDLDVSGGDLIDGQEVKPVGADGKVRKFRGIPEDVKLFEVFWQQVVNLIKVGFRFSCPPPDTVLADPRKYPQARPDLSIQDITALLVSLANLSLSCYPAQLTYIDQVLSFALYECASHASSADVHHPTTTANLLALLLAPIQNYINVLTLLALPSYEKLLYDQPYASRRSVAHAVVASVLKNETVIDSPEDVKGVLELCHVLVRDQKDRPAGPGRGAAAVASPQLGRNGTNAAMAYDREEMAEEQGWIARIVHLFRAEDLGVQFSVRAHDPLPA